MSEVLISILRGETEEEISDKVLDFKKSMTTIDVTSIFKTQSLKNLSKYIPKGKRNLFSVGKGTPFMLRQRLCIMMF